MRVYLIAFCLSGLLLAACNSVRKNNTPLTDTAIKDYDKRLGKLEQQALDKTADDLGTQIDKIDFKVKTTNHADYQDGYIPWIELANADKNLPNLADKDRIVITQKKITVIIDYPLTTECRFTLTSGEGFTKGQLFTALSEHYYQLYKEEEATATIKTIPMSQRKTLANRNQTNGKYGIWGHDIADLALSGVIVYRAANGEIILSLDIES